jgi:FtsP/CotA-like multicopper oxidase with cupredoxin domain
MEMKLSKTVLLSGIAFLAIVVAGCSTSTTDHGDMDHGDMNHGDMNHDMNHSDMEHEDTDRDNEDDVASQEETEQINTSVVDEDGKKIVHLEASEKHWMFNDDLMQDAWVYNDSLPGQEIRVQEGDHVQVHFTNALPVPTAVHFHGVPLPNEMDGVPGITQNAVMPGEEFVYEFVADAPGTYWYHSHQDGANQVEQGLYGTFIVEPADQGDYDVDQMITLNEVSSMMVEMGMDHGDMDHGDTDHGETEQDSMDHGDMEHGDNEHNDTEHGDTDHGDMEDMSHQDMMNQMYDTMIINGKADPQIQPIEVSEGDTVKLRFVNTGLFTQVITIPGHSFKVTHYDGQQVNEPQPISDQSIRIAPAERYDVEITMDQPGAWGIDVYAEQNPDRLQGTLPLVYAGHEDEPVQTADSVSAYFDITNYGEPSDKEYGDITKEWDMILATEDGGETFTINGQQMNTEEIEGHEVYEVEEGDIVKVTITNETDVDHPIHLHGHFFTVISRNGEPVSGSPVTMETLNVRPDETYEVVFVADNPGHWMFHCHELHHASDGMTAAVMYEGYEPNFTLDPDIPNKPE